MLKLMDQGNSTPAPTSSFLSTCDLSIDAHYTPSTTSADKQHVLAAHIQPPLSTSVCSPSSTSLHDQHSIDMLSTDQNVFSTGDPDSSVWAQEFLSGSIGEQKSTVVPCSADDGLQELLYPRTVLELLFSDQLKIEQMPSWSDILQAHAQSTASPMAGFTFPLASDKTNLTVPPTHDNFVPGVDSPQLDVNVPQYIHNSHFTGAVDDRMSSSTASSTLSDNAIDQWPVPPVCTSGVQCEATIIMPTSPLMANMMQHIDQVQVKHENINNDQGASAFNEKGNGFEGCIMGIDHEQKPNNLLISKLWNSGVANPSDPLLTHINHKHHIYESITAANFSQNLRQIAGVTPVGVCNLQPMNSMHNALGGPVPGHKHYVHQASEQLAKKLRTLHDGGGTARDNGDHADKERAAELMARSEVDGMNAFELDAKPSMQALLMATAAGSNLTLQQQSARKQQQQQLSGTEYDLKRSRLEQQAPPPSSSTSSTASAASCKPSQPVRKEKLSERITTLQQLVSPFGKTDTASVLMEAIGYIKFLQEQVQALSSPYFKSSAQNGEICHNGEEVKRDLRSRGLCLVPLSCTLQVANDNGADYWYGSSFR